MQRSSALKYYIPALAWFLITTVLFMLPGSEFPKPIPWMQTIYFDKWVHAGIFGLLTWLFLKPFIQLNKRKSAIDKYAVIVSTLLIIWGLAVEFIQDQWIPFRGFEWEDWGADVAGVVAGLCFFYQSTVKKYLSKQE
jgi:hypothetical protein